MKTLRTIQHGIKPCMVLTGKTIGRQWSKKLILINMRNMHLDIFDLEHWMIVLPSNWAFKCKRYIDGTIRKLKASFYARADHPIEGVDFFDTFAPVINWTAVLMMLILSIILGVSKLIKLITRLHLYMRQLI
jgi:hypothetical protein